LMRNNTDPFFVDLNSNRNRYCADLVHLLISRPRDAVGKACKFVPDLHCTVVISRKSLTIIISHVFSSWSK
jgi:hypothetical protein